MRGTEGAREKELGEREREKRVPRAGVNERRVARVGWVAITSAIDLITLLRGLSHDDDDDDDVVVSLSELTRFAMFLSIVIRRFLHS